MTDNTPPKLLKIKADAIVMIGNQINIGKNLLKRQPSYEHELEDLKNDTKKWTDYNKTLFSTLFDKSPLPDWHGEPVLHIGLQSLGREIAEHKENISNWINDLESIYGRLELYEELPSNTQQTMNKDTMNNENKKYFIGHGGSLEWLKLRDFLQNTLKLPYEEFNRIPQAGKITSLRLKEMLESCCMAFLIMTGEDEHTDGTLHARENVIHEIGLFQAQLGYEKAIILREEGCEIFSNIQGITYISFPKGNIKAVFEDIRQVLERESILKPEPIPEQPAGQKRAIPRKDCEFLLDGEIYNLSDFSHFEVCLREGPGQKAIDDFQIRGFYRNPHPAIHPSVVIGNPYRFYTQERCHKTIDNILEGKFDINPTHNRSVLSS